MDVFPETLRAAVVQMNTTEDIDSNVTTTLRLIDESVARGARLIVLPEKFHYLGKSAGVAKARLSLEGALLGRFAEAARTHRVHLVAGSVWEEVPGEDRTYNTSVLFSPDGRRSAFYRKIHMFDVQVGGHVYRESDDCLRGDQVVAVTIRDWAAKGEGGGAVAAGESPLTLGLSVCYDLRFPELFRALADLGAHVVTMPSAFTTTTGRDHWEVLVRARAIENQVFVIAANQCGKHGAGLESYGRSMIVDPWGLVLAQAADGEGIAVADLDVGAVARVRAALPSFANRVPEAYERRVLLEEGS